MSGRAQTRNRESSTHSSGCLSTHDIAPSRRYGSSMGAIAIDNTILPTAADIQAAAKRLAGVAVKTPLINAPVLDDAIGARVFLKAEILQRTGSFKFRGAYNKIACIPSERRAAGVVA